MIVKKGQKSTKVYNMAIVYQHRRLDTNEIFYVGIGKTEKRAFSKKGRNKYWNRIIDKTEYIVEILFQDITWDEACQKEIELIKQYGRKDLNLGTLCNLTDGGEGIINPSDENRLKLSLSKKGKKRSDEDRKKISIGQLGHKRNLGNIHSEEHKQKISDTMKQKNIIPWNKGIPCSDEVKLKVSNFQKGRKRSDETKEKMRKPKSEEQKLKMSLARKQYWINKKNNIVN